MKRFIFIFALFIAFIHFEASSQFDIAWYKILPNNIGTVNFSHDSKWIMAFVTPNILIYDVETQELINEKIPATECQFPVFSNDDSHIYGKNANRITYFNLETGLNESHFESSDKDIMEMRVSSDENYILATTEDGFRVWDVETGKIIKSKIIQKETNVDLQQYGSLGISCDNNKILVSTNKRYKYFDNQGNVYYKYDIRLNVYDFKSLEVIDILYDRDTNSTGALLKWIEFSDDCKYLAIISGAIYVYNFQSKELISTIGYSSTLSEIKFTSDNKYLVTASSSSADILILWDVDTGERLRERGPASYSTLDIANNRKFISSSTGKVFVLYNFPNLDGINDSETDTIEILYPNPTNGLLTLDIDIPISSNLNIYLNNMKGNNIKVLHNGFLEKGLQTIKLNLSEYPSGTYLLRMTALNYDRTYKIMIVK